MKEKGFRCAMSLRRSAHLMVGQVYHLFIPAEAFLPLYILNRKFFQKNESFYKSLIKILNSINSKQLETGRMSSMY